MAKWVVHIKGDLEDPTRSYELSVVREDNQFGLDAWGWGGIGKIILFGTGSGKNALQPRTPETVSLAMYAANSLRDALNRRERIETKTGDMEQVR